MAGPTALVMVAGGTAGLDAAMEAVEGIAALIAARRDGDEMDVHTTTPVGGTYEGQARPFLARPSAAVLEMGAASPAELLDWCALYRREFGWRPDGAVLLTALCNSDWDHRVLAELALAVVDRIGRVGDMDGSIVPRRLQASAPGGEPLSALSPQVEAFVHTLPGKAVAVPYLTAAGRCSATHTVDATFLRAWLRDPEFRMAK